MYKLLRDIDRRLNENSYPLLCYPELYLLEGGYQAFFSKIPEACEPRGYVTMKAHGFEEECAAGRAKLPDTQKKGRFLF